MWFHETIPIILQCVVVLLFIEPGEKMLNFMNVSLLINCAISAIAFLITKQLIPSLRDMFIAANLFGNDLCKRDKPKMWVISYSTLSFVADFSGVINRKCITMFDFLYCRPEAMGVVTGCVFLIALFLFIPVPFVFNEKQINEFPHNQVRQRVPYDSVTSSYHMLQQWNVHFFSTKSFSLITVNWIDIGTVVDLLHDPVRICRWCFEFAMAP